MIWATRVWTRAVLSPSMCCRSLSPCSQTAFRQDDAGDLLAEDVGIEVSPRLIRLNEHERWRQSQSPKSHRDAGRAAHTDSHAGQARPEQRLLSDLVALVRRLGRYH